MVRKCLWDKELTRGQVITNPDLRKKMDCGKDCIKRKECMKQKNTEEQK